LCLRWLQLCAYVCDPSMTHHTVKLPDAVKPEKVFVSGCINYGSAFVLKHSAKIGASDLLGADLGSVYGVSLALASTGRPVDPVSIQLAWEELGDGSKCPLALLGTLPDECPCEAAGDEAAERVIKLSAERRLAFDLAAAQETLEEGGGVDGALAKVHEHQATGRDVECFDGSELSNILAAETGRRVDTQGQLQGIATGFKAWDRMTEGLQKGELSVVGARPSQGKSALAGNVAAHVAFNEHIPVLFVSLEMSAYALARRLAACRGEVGLAGLRNGVLSNSDFARFSAFCLELKKTPIHIVYAPGMDSGRLALLIRQYKCQHGVEVVIVDYLQQIRAVGRHEKRTYEVGSVSTSLKAAAVKNDVAILAPCQLSRGPEQDGNRSPRISDLADSAQIDRDADTITLITFPNRAEHPDRVTLIVAKQRDGACGAFSATWNEQLARMENPPVEM